MMKWNSSKTYTEDDMARMRLEAVNRVRDFQDRARSVGALYEVPEEAITPVPEMPETPPAEEVCRPQRTAGAPRMIEAQARVLPEPSEPPAADPTHGLLGKLGLDSETLLILGLILLLYNEKADHILLLALGYLLL